jgi:diamine N-acetyltransferase
VIHIKPATDRDAEALAELGRRTFTETFAQDNTKEDIDLYVAETFGAEKQLREIRDPNRWIEIAWSGTQAAGYLHLIKSSPDPSVEGADPVELLRLYVASPWHGKGVGAALMERAIQISQREGFRTLWLGVWERNFRAQSFYRKYGFARSGSHVFKLGTDSQVDFILTRPV